MSNLVARWQHQFVQTNQVRLHYVTQGEGDLVVLLHGCPEFWYSWRYQIPSLARYFKVVVPDLRGYNESDKPTQGYDFDTLSNDIQGLIASLGYQRAHIVGHDWGGAIAWHLAHHAPQWLQTLTVLNAPHPKNLWQEITGNIDQLSKSWYFLAMQLPGLPEWILQNNLSTFVTNFFRGLATRKGAFTSENHQIYQAALAKPGVISAVVQCYRYLFSPQTWWQNHRQWSHPISVPTLVLWGEDDSFWSQKMTASLADACAAPFQLKLISQCGHWIQQEVPQTVNRELLQFLRGQNTKLKSPVSLLQG